VADSGISVALLFIFSQGWKTAGYRRQLPMNHPNGCKLSICVATYNRAAFLRQTLNSIVSQLTDECEVVVSDNASTDETALTVESFLNQSAKIRYIRQIKNHGVDRNYDFAVEAAVGEFCWLMADDDFVKPGAIARVLSELSPMRSFIFVNVEFRNFDMSRLLQRRMLHISEDRVYKPDEADRLLVDLDIGAWYIGSYIFRRSVWLERDRARYYDTLFVYYPVVFQKELPSDALLIAEPLVSYRMGNSHTYWSRGAEIMFELWPSLVAAMPVNSAAKDKVKSSRPWSSLSWLFLLRGWGLYSLHEYTKWIRPRLGDGSRSFLQYVVAILPGWWVNSVLRCYYHFRHDRGRELHWLSHSPHNVRRLIRLKANVS
jgi:abequosyltransferase